MENEAAASVCTGPNHPAAPVQHAAACPLMKQGSSHAHWNYCAYLLQTMKSLIRSTSDHRILSTTGDGFFDSLLGLISDNRAATTKCLAALTSIPDGP